MNEAPEYISVTPSLGHPFPCSRAASRRVAACRVPDWLMIHLPPRPTSRSITLDDSSAAISQELSIDPIYRVSSSCLVPSDLGLLVTLNLCLDWLEQVS